MTAPSDWIALAERAEKATAPDRDLDAALAFALNLWNVGYGNGRELCPRCTSSLDAITALISEKLPGWFWACGTNEARAWSRLWPDEDSDSIKGKAATPALALCAAFARAMAEKAKEPINATE